MKRLCLLISIFLLISCNKDNTVTIGYQLMANPWKVLIANGQLKELANKKIEFKKFNSGAKVINAMASGDVDIAIAGSTPIAAGLSQGLDIKLLWVMEIIGDAEAMVVKKEIENIEDLKGKKIAVPYGSTTHFHLMLALKEAGIKDNEVTILNLTPPSIVASWKKGDIDAAFVWSPALEDIKKTGKVLLSSKDMAQKGVPTFDGIIVRGSFLKENKAFTKQFLNKLVDLNVSYNNSPWTKESKEVEVIANFVGSSNENVANTLKGYIFPNKDTHPTANLSQILLKTAKFLKEQGKTEQVLESYDSKIAIEVIKEL